MSSGLQGATLPHAAEGVSGVGVPRAGVAAGPACWRRSARGCASEEPFRPVPFAVLPARPALESLAPLGQSSVPAAGLCLRARAPQSASNVAVAAPCTLSGACRTVRPHTWAALAHSPGGVQGRCQGRKSRCPCPGCPVPLVMQAQAVLVFFLFLSS